MATAFHRQRGYTLAELLASALPFRLRRLAKFVASIKGAVPANTLRGHSGFAAMFRKWVP